MHRGRKRNPSSAKTSYGSIQNNNNDNDHIDDEDLDLNMNENQSQNENMDMDMNMKMNMKMNVDESDNKALDNDIQTPPNTKRIRLNDNSELSDDNTISTTTFGSCHGERPSISPQLKFHHHQNHRTGSNHNNGQQIIDLGVEFPALPNVLNPKHIQQELRLDPEFDLGQFSKQIQNQNQNQNIHIKEQECKQDMQNMHNIQNVNDKMERNLSSFPMIFDWDKLKEATDPQQLRTEALRKQERGKYVRRDSLSSEQAADRRYINLSSKK